MPRRWRRCRIANTSASTSAACFPSPRGALVTGFLESFFLRYVEYDFTADLEEKLDQISAGELAWKEVLREFWRDFVRRRRHQGLARHRGHRRAQPELGPLAFPEREDGTESALLPELRQRQAVPEDRQIRRLYRLLQLSRVQFYPPARRRRPRRRRGRRRRPEGARQRSRQRRRDHARTGRFGPYVQAGDGKEARRACPKGWQAAASIWRRRWSCCRCRARSASIPESASRSSPASAATVRSSSMTANTPISIPSRRSSPSASTAQSRRWPKRR